MATRKKLPNLKICVDNTQSSDESDVEVDGSDSSSYEEDGAVDYGKVRTKSGLEDGEVPEDDENDVLSIGTTEPTERRFLSRSSLRQTQPTYGPRVYENKGGNFVTGVDVTSEEASEKREKRAHKFGTLSTPKQPITDMDIKNLYKSLGMSTDTLDQDIRGWRTDAILLRGTENMSTKDVFDYFSEYAPKSIEWIDDFSCNVLWQDKLTPARALLKLSSSMEEVGSPGKPSNEQKENSQDDDPLNRDKQTEHIENVTEVNKQVTKVIDGAAVTPASEKSDTHEQSATKNVLQDEPVLNVLEEETMELDYDDNLDLTGEDPIDQALSTWANFSQNKKLRAEQASELADRKKSETQKDKEKPSEKKKSFQEIVIKEEKDVNEKAFSDNRNKSNEKARKSRNHPEREVGNEKRSVDARAIHQKNAALKADRSKYASKDTENKKSVLNKRKEKMDTSGGSDSESSSTYSSSSSGSSSSGSSSDSDSESGSGSSSSSSSSSVEGTRKKQRKTPEQRDKEHKARKTTRKAAAPPILPQTREKADIPWPPGWWRLGVPHPKAKTLFMRYAMKADKKVPGAEKRSQYYKKYGNPNFGGAVGLISNSRKRKLRNIDIEEGEYVENQEVLETGENFGILEGVQSRLAGRIGTRGENSQRKRRGEENNDESDHENSRPRLKEGKDLRELLNRDVSALQPEIAGEEAANNDSDDEMDYGAELERLMGDDGPPSKKRFMRMHADDEEEKILAKRLTTIKKETKKWPRQDESYEDDREEEEIVEEEEEEEEETFKPRRKEWVDYDNVDDDDPFNLFGTSKKEQGHSKKTLNADDDDELEYEQTFRKEAVANDRRGRDVKQRLGGDLRAKLQGLKRVSNRTW